MRNADEGIAVLAVLLERSTSEIINEADRLGVQVKRTPEIAGICPWCGNSVPVSSPSWWKAGLCEACYQKHLHECKVQREREKSARRQNDLDRQHLKRYGHI